MTAQGYGINQEQETFDLEEGNFTRNDSLITDKGIAKGGSFAAEVSEGEFVQIYTSADNTVQTAASGIVIGFLDGPARGRLPAASKNSGQYTRRYGNITLVGFRKIRAKLVAANAAVAPGDYLALDSTKIGFDKEEDNTTSTVIALETADSSTGKAIWALEKGPVPNEAD